MSPVRRFLGGGDHGIAAAVYGTVLAMASIAAGAFARVGPRELIGIVMATSFVIWLAHVYAYTLGKSIERSRRLRWEEFKSLAVNEGPILGAAAAPISVLLLGAVGLVEESTDIWIAFGVGLVALAVQGERYARVAGLGGGRTVVVILLNLALGGIVVTLKALVTH